MSDKKETSICGCSLDEEDAVVTLINEIKKKLLEEDRKKAAELKGQQNKEEE